MTTAQARIAAMQAADRCDWSEAARLTEIAIANYPVLVGRNGNNNLAHLDLAKPNGRLDGYRDILASIAV